MLRLDKLNYKKLSDKDFISIAKKLMFESKLKVNDKYYQLIEIEFYLHNKNHKDTYTHCNQDQLNHCSFYFHKFRNGSYKGGTFKGMDMCFGDKDSNTYFGVLIRSIREITTQPEISDKCKVSSGPCLVVNKILENYDCENVETFTNNEIINMYDNDKDFILEDCDTIEKEDLYCGPRIGLSDKYPEYRDKHYRFVVGKKNVKKQVTSLILCK